jgi:phenylacetate-CoA ligase
MFYGFIYALIDKLSGYNMKQGTCRALEFDYLTRPQINNYQQQKFRELSKIAATSEYFRNFFEKPLKEFPLINRAEYSRNYARMKTRSDHPYVVKQSSGSTGLPVKQFVTKDMLLAKRSSHQKMLIWYGLNRESREFKLGGLYFNFSKKLYYLLRQKRCYDSYSISDRTLGRIIKSYNRFKPDILYGYPSTINEFIMFARNCNIELFHPRIIVTHAENLFKDISVNFKSIFPDTKIVNQYWSTEANIAETCPQGNLHIDEDTVISEIPFPDRDGYGDLYITNLFSYVVPIIRYKIGDRVKISDKICSCGRNTKIIESLEGRENEYLELPDGNKFPITAMQEIGFAQNLLYYQLIYYKMEKKILFKYVPVKNDLPIKKEFISTYIRDKFGLSTEFELVSSIERSQGGKLKRLIVKE